MSNTIKRIIDNNRNSAVKPTDVLRPSTQWADEELANSRFLICKDCPELIKLTTQCKQCGCFMKIKSKLIEAKCPLEKW